jgi:hypothetical protein
MELALVIAKVILCLGVIVTTMVQFTAPVRAVVKRSICLFCQQAFLMVYFAMSAVEYAHEGKTALPAFLLFTCFLSLGAIVTAYVRAVRPKEAAAVRAPREEPSAAQG